MGGSPALAEPWEDKGGQAAHGTRFYVSTFSSGLLGPFQGPSGTDLLPNLNRIVRKSEYGVPGSGRGAARSGVTGPAVMPEIMC